MSPELIIKPPQVRSKYSFLFGCIAELYRFHYGRKPSSKFEDIKAAVEEMKRDEKISDYLSTNLDSLFGHYPELMPGKFQEQSFLDRLDAGLDLIIGDLCAEISELSAMAEKNERESLIAWLNGGRKS